MEKNIFQLDNEQLKEIARSFKAKVEEGLNTENAEIQCIPTFITPKASSINGKSLVLDLGGTNYRVAIVDFSKVPPTIHPNNGWKKRHVGYEISRLYPRGIIQRIGRHDYRNKTGKKKCQSDIAFLIRQSLCQAEMQNSYAGQKELT